MKTIIFENIADYKDTYNERLISFIDDNKNELDFLSAELVSYKKIIKEDKVNGTDDIRELFRQLKKAEYNSNINKIIDFIEVEILRQQNIIKTISENKQQARIKSKIKQDVDCDITFEKLFKKPEIANITLDKLKEIFPDLLSDDYSYLKGIKGIFPMFIGCLSSLDFINKHSDLIYKNALNNKIKNLNLSKDASEFRKSYKSIENGNKRTDLKLILSEISH